jgi:hypothetical protein
LTTDTPIPFVPADVDLSKFDGFMLNTERLLGSELVALSTGEEFKAAILLWCRAWKQRPAASLPNNEKVLASFAGVPLAKWRKIRGMALRGFVLCSDGRLYHPILAADAIRAHKAAEQRRNAIRKRWDGAPEDTKLPTGKIRPNDARTTDEIPKTGQGRDIDSNSEAKASGGEPPMAPLDLDKEFWRTSKAFLAQAGEMSPEQAGGIIGRWRKDHSREAVMSALARAQAENPSNVVEFIAGCLRRGGSGGSNDAASVMPIANSPDDSWRRAMGLFVKKRLWVRNVDGPPPGHPNCRVPPHILAEFGFGKADAA